MSRTKILTAVGSALIVVLGTMVDGAFLVPIAHAQVANLVSDDSLRNMQGLFSILIAIFNVGTWVLFSVLQFLLDPVNYFDLEGTGGLEAILNTLWRLSRDLTNIIFAIALIGVALYTVITANRELITQHAAKFVLAVVIVNFSWFLPRLVLDAGNVLASGIYGIPSLIPTTVEGGMCVVPTSPDDKKNITDECSLTDYGTILCPCKALADIKFFPEKDALGTNPANSIPILEAQGYDCSSTLACMQWVNLNDQVIAGHSAILNGLVVNHARLQQLTLIAPPEAGIHELLMNVIRLAIVLIIQSALLFPLAAMAAAFFIRIPVLWLTVAFMPFAALGLVLDDRFTQGFPKKILDAFVKAAFMPAVVAVPLAIGYTLINAASARVDIGSILGGLNQISLPLLSTVSDLWQLLWLIISLMVLYVGVFTALQAMQIEGTGMDQIIQRIRDAGTVTRMVAQQVPKLIRIPGTSLNVGQALSQVSPVNLASSIRGKLQPPAPKPGGSAPVGLNLNQRNGATSAAARLAKGDAQFGGAPLNAASLRTLVGNAADQGVNSPAMQRLREALNALNANLNAQNLSSAQLAAVLQHMQEGADNVNRVPNLITPQQRQALQGTNPTTP